MKHIAFFMPTLGGGGAERVTMALARGMAARGYRVSLLVAVATGSLAREVPRNVSLVDLKAGRVIAAIWPLARWLTATQPDVLISSQGHANIAAYAARFLCSIRCRLLVREESTPSINLRHLRGIKSWLWRILLRHVYGRADAVIAVSHGVADDLRAYLRCDLPRLRVIYNPIITPELYEKAKEPLDHPWFQPGEIPVVLAVGRLTEAKNYPLLIRAFARVQAHRPARLMILGEGEDRADLERLVRELGLAESVALPGFDRNPFRYMARCTVYAMSSTWEGLPGALVEGLALAPRVVSTDCPSGPSEILERGRLGRLVPSGNYLELADAISAALDDGGGLGPSQEGITKRFGEVCILDSFESVF